jgi:uncharacterized protein
MNEPFSKLDTPLPVFAVGNGQFTALYTPGLALNIKAIPVFELNKLINSPDEIVDPASKSAITSILKKARDVVNSWEYLRKLPFLPESLTIHVGNDCSLKCSYCYSKASGRGNKTLSGFPDKKAISSIINYIAENRNKNLSRFTVVYHGSGEPTFHWQQLVDSFNKISEIALQHCLQIFTYIATNGCLTDKQADWLAANMDGIGISCDGPQDIQQRQRTSGNIIYPPIDKVCKRILEKGGRIENRVTITQDTLPHLGEITEYLIEKCLAKTIRIEPVFLAGENGFKEDDAEFFLNSFIKIRGYAENLGVSLTYAGIRMSELHGTYCDVLRNNLRLNTDNVSRNCFCFLSDRPEFITGRLNEELTEFHLNNDVQLLKNTASGIPGECHQCINIFHCSRGCPDFCMFGNIDQSMRLNPFRCKLHKLLAVSEIKNLAK